ncbi:MAG: hypothetical protein SFZ03_02285 [Candidatus Melainabacteria bacterium]|nr:hypothetical protein [Candidatus Melainabacteria bacterium]
MPGAKHFEKATVAQWPWVGANLGQSVAEYAMVGGVVLLVCIPALGLMSGGFQNGFAFIQAQLQGSQSGLPAARFQPVRGSLLVQTALSAPQNTSNLSVSINNAAPSGVATPVAQGPSLSGVNGQNLVGSGTTTTSQEGLTASTFADNGQEISDHSSDLLELADDLRNSNPQAAAAIEHLALTGKRLAGFQLNVAADYAAQVEQDVAAARRYDHQWTQLAKEIGAQDFVFWANDGVAVVSAASKNLANQAQTFQTEYQSLAQGGNQYNLSRADWAQVVSLGGAIASLADVATLRNVQNTLANSQAIQTCAAGKC